MPPQYKRKIIKYFHLFWPTIKVGIFFLFAVLIIAAFLSWQDWSAKNYFNKDFFTDLIFDKEYVLKNYQGRTNVILLGIAGGNHEGSDLTDAIIFLSIDRKKKDAVEVSIPRDIWSPTLKDKVNTAYHYGEEKKSGRGGLVLAKATVEEIVGVPIHYGWLVDFSGFKKLIDLVGGVDIFVENSFTDNLYPIPGREEDFCGGDPIFACRFEKLQFERGLQHMDGEKALKYVRSRQAEGEEGSDFARGKRQQQVMAALKNKILNPSFFWQNLTRLKELSSAFDEATDTDMKLAEQILFFKTYAKLPDEKIRRLILDTGDLEKERKGFLVNPPLWQYNGTWVLIPRKGEADFDEIHKYVACNLENPACLIKP